MKVVRIDERAAARRDLGRAEAAVSAAARVRGLMAEARAAAAEHLEALEAAIQVARDLALDVSAGGEAYGVGAREASRQLAEDLFWRGKTLKALTARERAGRMAH